MQNVWKLTSPNTDRRSDAAVHCPSELDGSTREIAEPPDSVDATRCWKNRVRSSINWLPAPGTATLETKRFTSGWPHSINHLQRSNHLPALSRRMNVKERHDSGSSETGHTTLRGAVFSESSSGPTSIRGDSRRFDDGAREKPALRTKPEIRFNLAHTRDLALYAFARGRDVGADLEEIRPAFAADEIASRHFLPRELAAWRSSPISVRTEEFFYYWTCKEAYVKATGLGLWIPLQSFEVSLNENGEGRILSGEVDAGWQVLTFLAAESHPAALVYRGEPCTICFFSYDPIAANTSGTLR